MPAIDDIRKEVFAFLMERHYQAKERGEEFYFTISSESVRSLPDYLKNELSGEQSSGEQPVEEPDVFFSDKPWLKGLFKKRNPSTERRYLSVSFFDQRPIAYLIITESLRVFLVIKFSTSGKSSKLADAAGYLREFTIYELQGELTIYEKEPSGGIDIEHTIELTRPEMVTGKLFVFIDKIKPAIDRCFEDIRHNSQYAYLFLTKAQFDEYLASEPNYTPPKPIRKVNLALASLRVRNFQGIHRCDLIDLPESARWIVLTGRNGYGKTSMLQAMAAGLFGSYDESGRPLIPDSATVTVSYYADGERIETESTSSRMASTDRNLTGELATYGSSRLQVTATVSSSAIESQSPATYSLFNSDGLLLNVEQLLKDSKSYSEAFYNQLVELFKALIPQLADIQIAVVKRLPEVRYFEKDESGNPLSESMTFSQLAAGFRNIIAMIGDMVYRLSTKQEVENLQDLQGIVIIDEFELHLHPFYQKLLPEMLSRQFPHLQFIVSTHSPIPLLGIPKDVGVVLLHVTRTAETGIVVERLDVDFSTLTPNSILSSPIFGFHDLIPDSKPDDKMVRTEDTFAEVVADEQMRKNISEFLTPERQQELLNLIQKK